MPIDFFNPTCASGSVSDKFGLCDDTPPPAKPAYIDESDTEKWIAIVENPDRIAIRFFAIDNCLDIVRDDGKSENKCDGFLYSNKQIIFVELKNRTKAGWVAKGREQITATLAVFKQQYDLSEYHLKVAYICNKQRPISGTSSINEKQAFFEETGLILKVEQRIHSSVLLNS